MSRGATSIETKAAVARRGVMLVLSSPSGAGKTTLSRMLLDADPEVDAVGVGHHPPAAYQ